MSYLILGTAGHIDHGKTTLVKALTGVDTDRLKEEKKRGITIELGFAPLKLGEKIQLGVVDVPGHERFVHHMLAGAAGIDLVMLVIGADEGVMPQTKEHLDIIQLLGVKKGIIVITKTDLVEIDWLEVVKEEIKEITFGTILEKSPIVCVSSYTGEGIEELKEKLRTLAMKTIPKISRGNLRLPIDRIFTMQGIGTVITGTLFNGTINKGETVEVLPEGKRLRVRNIHVHGNEVDKAEAGQRVAVNLANVEVSDIKRGSVAVKPETTLLTNRIDVQLTLIKGLKKNLVNGQRVHFHLGTAQVLARAVLLDRDELKPGEKCFAQINLEEPIVAFRKDSFVIRNYSPLFTIGGGVIIEEHPQKHKRYKEEVLENLELQQSSSPIEIVENYILRTMKILNKKELLQTINMDKNQLVINLEKLINENIIIELEDYVIHIENEKILGDKINEYLRKYHKKYPLRLGVTKEELRTQISPDIPSRVFFALLNNLSTAKKLMLHSNQYVSMTHFKAEPQGEQKHQISKLFSILENQGMQATNIMELCNSAKIHEKDRTELIEYLQKNQEIIALSEKLFITYVAFTKAKEKIINYLNESQEMTVSEAKDILGVNRKTIIPILELFDQQKITKREGDKRILVNKDN